MSLCVACGKFFLSVSVWHVRRGDGWGNTAKHGAPSALMCHTMLCGMASACMCGSEPRCCRADVLPCDVFFTRARGRSIQHDETQSRMVAVLCCCNQIVYPIVTPVSFAPVHMHKSGWGRMFCHLSPRINYFRQMCNGATESGTRKGSQAGPWPSNGLQEARPETATI